MNKIEIIVNILMAEATHCIADIQYNHMIVSAILLNSCINKELFSISAENLHKKKIHNNPELA